MNALKSMVIIACLLVGGISFAQPGGGQRGGQQGPPQTPNATQIKKMVTELSEKVSLSEEQEETVLELYTEHFEQVEKKTSGNSRPNREDMEALKSELVKGVKAELSKEQITKYEAWLKTQEQQRPQRQRR